MAIRNLRLGSSRQMEEGLCVGTVRHPPRGVPQSEYARRDFYDMWLPTLSPIRELMQQAKRFQDEAPWSILKKLRCEMNKSDRDPTASNR